MARRKNKILKVKILKRIKRMKASRQVLSDTTGFTFTIQCTPPNTKGSTYMNPVEINYSAKY